MITTTATTLPCPTTIKGVVGSSCNGCNVLWFYSVCSYYVARGENYKAKAWERICRRNSLLDKLSTRTHNLFVSTPRIAQ